MQNFEALKKPVKPGEALSPPRSPRLEDSNLYLTPEFSQQSPSSYSVHRRVYSREATLEQKEDIEHFSKENKRLIQRIMHLERTQEEILNTNQKLLSDYNEELRQKTLKWETILIEKDLITKRLQTQIEKLQHENDFLKGSPSKYSFYKFDCVVECEKRLNQHLESLSKFNEENAEIDGFITAELINFEQEADSKEASGFDDLYNVSAIQEEGKIMSLGQTQVEPGFNESFENTIHFNKENYSSSIRTDQLEDLDLPSIRFLMSPQSVQIQLLQKIRDKDEEITKHKEFIRKLKISLESMLQDYSKSRIENVKNRQEIQELKEKLGLTLPRRV